MAAVATLVIFKCLSWCGEAAWLHQRKGSIGWRKISGYQKAWPPPKSWRRLAGLRTCGKTVRKIWLIHDQIIHDLIIHDQWKSVKIHVYPQWSVMVKHSLINRHSAGRHLRHAGCRKNPQRRLTSIPPEDGWFLILSDKPKSWILCIYQTLRPDQVSVQLYQWTHVISQLLADESRVLSKELVFGVPPHRIKSPYFCWSNQSFFLREIFVKSHGFSRWFSGGPFFQSGLELLRSRPIRCVRRRQVMGVPKNSWMTYGQWKIPL